MSCLNRVASLQQIAYRIYGYFILSKEFVYACLHSRMSYAIHHYKTKDSSKKNNYEHKDRRSER